MTGRRGNFSLSEGRHIKTNEKLEGGLRIISSRNTFARTFGNFGGDGGIMEGKPSSNRISPGPPARFSASISPPMRRREVEAEGLGRGGTGSREHIVVRRKAQRIRRFRREAFTTKRGRQGVRTGEAEDQLSNITRCWREAQQKKNLGNR